MILMYLSIAFSQLLQANLLFPSALSKAKNLSVCLLLSCIYLAFVSFNLFNIGLFVFLLLLLFYFGFYNDQEIRVKGKYFLVNALLCLIYTFSNVYIPHINMLVTTILLLSFSYLFFVYLDERRDILLYFYVLLWSALMLGFVLFVNETSFVLIVYLFSLYAIEFIYMKNKSHYDVTTKSFQTNVMVHHYEEVKSVYLNMRGWKHDYHNHLQSLKAYLSKNQVDQAQQYLANLEHDLQRVDSLVKSGNVMIDAIVNAKLSIALTKHIKINESVYAPEHLCINDVDLCIILANLFDNAIEACEKLEEEQRFIRLYINTLQEQLYISIVNSASEQVNENQKRYISEKRGNHGHGMKRVKLSVDKYNGYLNLKNEVGVFACEVMIPLVYEN